MVEEHANAGRDQWSHDDIPHCRICRTITVETQIVPLPLPAVTLSVSASFLSLWFSDCRSFMRRSAWLSWASSSASSSLLPSWNSSSSSWASWKLWEHREKQKEIRRNGVGYGSPLGKINQLFHNLVFHPTPDLLLQTLRSCDLHLMLFTSF